MDTFVLGKLQCVSSYVDIFFNITSIKNLGPGTPDTKPDPDENKAFLDVEFGVYPWIVRDQDADLE